MEDEISRVQAYIPKTIKRKLFSAIVMQDLTFTAWLTNQAIDYIEKYEKEVNRYGYDGDNHVK